MKVALSQIDPNPFRRIEHYPIDREKVNALRESIQETTFWNNVVGRRHPDKPGRVQLAYGHHRLVALKEQFQPAHEVDLIVRDLDDEMMFKIMSRENLEEWTANASVTLETVRVAVEGYAEGKWEIPKPSSAAGHPRYAPQFSPRGEDSGKPYTTATLAAFTGLPEATVEHSLVILAAEEEKLVSHADVKRLETAGGGSVGVRTVRDAVTEVRRAVRDAGPRTDPKAAARRAVDALVGVRERDRNRARQSFRSAVEKVAKPKRTVNYEALAREVGKRIAGFWDQIEPDLQAVVNHADKVPLHWQKAIIEAIDHLTRLGTALSAGLKGNARPRTAPKGLLSGGAR